MIVAIPLKNERHSEHFTDADSVRLMDIDMANHTVRETWKFGRGDRDAEQLPQWLRSLGVEVLLSGSIGFAQQDRLMACGIKVYTGGVLCREEDLVAAFVQGDLTVNTPLARGFGAELCNN